MRARDEAERDAANAREAAARRQADLEERLGAAIPPRWRDLDFSTFPGTHPTALQNCSVLRGYANTFKTHNLPQGISCLITGGVGTGKTGLALCVANSIVRDGLSAVYMRAYGAVVHQRDTWGRRGITQRQALDNLLAPDLLVLDDVGTGLNGAGELAMLFEVVDERYMHQKPTMLISNLPLPALREFLGQRIVDRFKDDGSFTLAFDWPSLRGVAEKTPAFDKRPDGGEWRQA